MTTTPQEPLNDDDMQTTSSDPMAMPATDADGTDGDTTDGSDGDSSDADSTDGTDADGTDA